MIGRQAETQLIESLIAAHKHVLLEGPVGSGKTSLALFIADHLQRKVVRVDGDGRFTEQKLVGSFDPKLVMGFGFGRKSFLPGPLYEAMAEGALLLLNELNRMPEMVQNVLLPVLEQNSVLNIPHLGVLKAAPGFCLIATQNPREFIGTAPIGEALLDRLEWVSIHYLSEDQEVEVLQRHLPGLSRFWAWACVILIRLTRSHSKIKRGASLRAALSLAELVLASKWTVSQLESENFWTLATSVLANRIELQVSKFSAQAYSASLSEVMSELRALLLVELKKDESGTMLEKKKGTA